jgi:SAM-dependent methyltransferase
MNDVYLKEYESGETVRKYLAETAGHGIAYVLESIYGPLYRGILDDLTGQGLAKSGFRVIEYGCGGGMNLLWIVRQILDRKLPLDLACGTDFASPMVEAATKECAATLGGRDGGKVTFHTIANENLAAELPGALGRSPAEILGSFHFIVGVNTFRYCFRLGKQAESARGIFSLLRPGGITVMIDMNHHFPFFRSKFRSKEGMTREQYYLPTLAEYDAVFRAAGFEIVTRKNFCWIPHSAGPGMTRTLRAISPVLNTLFRRFATRSLIVARKPR